MKEYLIAFLGGIVVGSACNDCVTPRVREQYEHAQVVEPYAVRRQHELELAHEKYGHWKEQTLEHRLQKNEGDEMYVIRR